MGALYDSLKPRYQRFIDEVLVSCNLSEAARLAGSKAKNIAQAGSQLLRKAEISEAIRERQDEIAKSLDVTPEKVIGEFARIGFSSIKTLFDENNDLRSVKDLDDDTIATISGIETVVSGSGENVVTVKKVRLWDKIRGLESLAKHLGLFDANNRQRWPKVIVKDFTGGRHDD